MSQVSSGNVNTFNLFNHDVSDLDNSRFLDDLFDSDDSLFHDNLSLLDSFMSNLDLSGNVFDLQADLNSDGWDLDFGDSNSQSVDDGYVSNDDSVNSDDSFVDNQSNVDSFSGLSDSNDFLVDDLSDLYQDFVSLFDDQFDLLFHSWARFLNFLFQDLDFDSDMVLFDNVFDVFLHDNLKFDNLLLGFLSSELKLFNLFGQDNFDFCRGYLDSSHGGYDSCVD
jgi:hypothetical protein